MGREFDRMVFFGSQITVGGAQRCLLDQAAWFHAKGYDVKVIFYYDKDGLLSSWQSSHEYPISTLSTYQRGAGMVKNLPALIKGFFRLVTLLRRNKTQVIECFTHDADIIGLPAAFLAGVKCRVGAHHGQFAGLSKAERKLHTAVINSRITSKMVCVSARAEKQALSEGIASHKLITIWNGIQPSKYTQETREEVRKELGLIPQETMILTVGRLVPEKTQHLLVRAADILREQLPLARYFIAGDGPLYGELDQLRQELNLTDRFSLLGTRNDVQRLLKAADLFVLYSETEGMPVSLMEAMDAGLPIVASNLEGIAELLPTEDYGVLIPSGNADTLATAIRQLSEDEQKMQKLRRNNPKRIAEHFSLNASCKKYETLFEEIIA